MARVGKQKVESEERTVFVENSGNGSRLVDDRLGEQFGIEINQRSTLVLITTEIPRLRDAEIGANDLTLEINEADVRGYKFVAIFKPTVKPKKWLQDK